ncbi:UDP-glucose dehydrogenase family protein [Microbacterium sp. YJN-G]|uniref:UDP-glucose dehydrogenase family protein n=1 Tax=Microbacterium sp. YJN-G TaxID=2763257 RepID=UPI001877C0B2|nr:UDP-glucose/GDP-mannose dehydrogenase family protein [Microbacterium sp. YJN-G]
MKLSVIGCGYLGAVHATAMASLGHEVVGVDVDAARIEMLRAGRAPFFEPGLDQLLSETVQGGALTFSSEISEAAGAAAHFIAVGTPQRAEGDGADLSYVDGAIESLIPILRPGDLVIGKSTVPVGTANRLAESIRPTGAHLLWNPEFLREGFAIKDTLEPDRLVYGVANVGSAADDVALLDQIYRSVLAKGTPRIVTDYATAELVKVSANAFLATKISFINAMAEIAEVTGADVTQLADAIGFDARIGRRFLNAGIGFGGGCLPKDIRAFSARAEELGVGQAVQFLHEVDAINLRRRHRVAGLVIDAFDGDARGHHVALLGLAFKPDSDDTRDSPALDVARRLHEAGATVHAFDPAANETARRVAPDLRFANSVDEAVQRAELIVIATEWKQFRDLSPSELATQTPARTIVDARNCLDPATWRAAGWTYHGMGRP